MFACLYRASLGLIGTLIIIIKKDKEKYFGEKNCIGVGLVCSNLDLLLFCQPNRHGHDLYAIDV